MEELNRFHYLFIVISLSVSIGYSTATASVVKAAYWPSWSSSFPPSKIDTTHFTHIYYAFLTPNNSTYKLEISNSTSLLLSNFTSTLRHKRPPVKTLLSIGGGASDPSLFARIASNRNSRKIFINSAVETARCSGFNGIDLDWEFPQSVAEMRNLGILFKEWRKAIKKEAKLRRRPALLLTAAVYFSADFFLAEIQRSYPIRSINRNLNWVNAMCFDYHGSWDTTQTGAHAALHGPNTNITTSYGLTSWIRAGLLKKKLVMGLPLYGRTWTLKDPKEHKIGSPAVAVGPGDGVLRYTEIEEFNKNATAVYDKVYVATYSYAGTSWVGYDDATSTKTKVRYARARGLRGYFFWEVSMDSKWKISKQASRAWKRKG